MWWSPGLNGKPGFLWQLQQVPSPEMPRELKKSVKKQLRAKRHQSPQLKELPSCGVSKFCQ
jgi:hypothetical protein